MADTDNQEAGTELKNELFYQSDDSTEDTGDSAAEEEEDDAAVDEEEDEEEEQEEEGEGQEGDKEKGQLTIGGKTATQDQIEELEQGNLRLADYTRKTQVVSEQVKALNTLTGNLEEKIAEVDAIIDEEQLAIDGIDIDVEGTDEVVKRERALKKKRASVNATKKKLAEAKTKADQSKAVTEGQEMQRLIPAWFTKSGNPSKQQDLDYKSIEKYLRKKGYAHNYISTISKAREFEQLLACSKYEELQKKKQGIKKKIKKATNIKGKKQSKSNASISTKDGAKMNKLFYG